jgi:hypothetical protein
MDTDPALSVARTLTVTCTVSYRGHQVDRPVGYVMGMESSVACSIG